jgi:hypothetical protein
MNAAKQAFDAAQQVRYDAIVAKHMPQYEESDRLYKEATALLEPYASGELPALGDTFHAAAEQASQKRALSQRIYALADNAVNREFWG